MNGLGRIQRAALVRLAGNPEGIASPDLTDLADRKAALHSLNALTRLGLAADAGRRVSSAADGRGQPPRVFVITDAGRERMGLRAS
jgi:hypothetical protein